MICYVRNFQVYLRWSEIMENLSMLFLGLFVLTILFYNFGGGNKLISNKINHWERMDLIEEKQELIKLRGSIDFESTLNTTDSLIGVINNQLE